MRFFWLLCFAITAALGCNPDRVQTDAPADRPYYPSALLQDDTALYVLSSNYDQRYARGSVLSVDLDAVDAGLAKAVDGAPVTIGSEAVTSSGYIPSLVDGATLSPAKDQIFYVSRGERTLRVVPLADKKIACSSGLGQDCYSGAAAASLTQNNPYFLVLTPSVAGGQDVAEAIVGYPLNAMFYRGNSAGEFPLPAYFELERFTWNTADKKAQLVNRVQFGNLVGMKQDPNFQALNARANVKIGGMVQRDGELFVLFENPSEMLVARSIFLARASLLELQSANPVPKNIALYDVGLNSSIRSAGPMVVRKAGEKLQVFTANEVPGVLLKLELPALATDVDTSGNLKVSLKSETLVCDFVNDLKLSPDLDQKKLVVACDDGRLLVYDTDSLKPFTIDPASGAVFGRVPMGIRFDDRMTSSPFRFYTANFHDGSISIYDLLDEAEAPNSSLLKAKGRVFAPSPLNREGGI